jgi:cell division septation protein DedD
MGAASADGARRSGPRRTGRLRGVLLGLALAVVGAPALAIAFTVQVIAVSDQATALDISRALLRDGFPAYVVRSTGSQGDVYRVRVGAFANRAAAARYAAAMPAVAGARPVPALAEAIPAGIMPLAPRVLWDGPVAGADLRIVPWPGGVALRRQAFDPLRQASYALVQGAEVRTVQAWRVAPLAELPSSPVVEAIEVPFVDLTLPPAAEAEAEAVEPLAEPEAGPEAAEADEGSDVVEDREPGSDPEVGLLLLRDRPLWPASWQDDGAEVRDAFRASTVALVANRLELDPAVVEGMAYLPGGAPPPALVVVEVSDRSGRDLGDIRGLGDPTQGVRPDGPSPLAGTDERWWPAPDLGSRVRLDLAAEAPVGGDEWVLTNDAGFVRITLAEGANWRAVAGMLLWSDGRYALVRDGADVVLIDFMPR